MLPTDSSHDLGTTKPELIPEKITQPAGQIRVSSVGSANSLEGRSKVASLFGFAEIAVCRVITVLLCYFYSMGGIEHGCTRAASY